MKFRKILTKILLVLLIVVTAALLVRAVLNFTEGRRLARTLANLKEQGIPLTFNDLVSTCPDEDNAARLWKAAEELLVIEGEDVKLINAAWQDFIREGPIDTVHREGLAHLIEKNRQALDLVLDAGARPCFRFGDFAVKSFERKIPNAVKMIRAVKLLGFDALFAAEKGDMKVAVDGLRKSLRFAPKIAEEGSLITFLLAVADMKQVLFCLNKSICGRNLGKGELLAVIGDLDDRKLAVWKDLFEKSIRGERIFYLDIGMEFMGQGLPRWVIGEREFTERLFHWLIRPLMKRDIVRNLPKYSELQETVRLPYFRTREFWEKHHYELEHLPWYSVISSLVLPNIEATFLKVASLEAVGLATRTGLACRVYKEKKGSYPESLSDLVPGLIPAVPIDPFTGDPFVYRREGEGFIVYSLGSNRKDDGGRSTWEITQMVTDKDDDWTWREIR